MSREIKGDFMASLKKRCNKNVGSFEHLNLLVSELQNLMDELQEMKERRRALKRFLRAEGKWVALVFVVGLFVVGCLVVFHFAIKFW